MITTTRKIVIFLAFVALGAGIVKLFSGDYEMAIMAVISVQAMVLSLRLEEMNRESD